MTLRRANLHSAATPVDPMVYYVPGSSALGPATSTDDYYHLCGLYGLRPHDLRAWGTHGAAMETLHGHRYFWMTGPDHPTSNTNIWRDSANFSIGFSDDPGILPQTLTPVIAWNNVNTGVHALYPLGEFQTYEWGWVVYNPDDPDSLPFYFSGEGAAISAAPIQHCQILWRSSDLTTWVCKTVSHAGTNSSGWGSFNPTRRLGTSNWMSHGTGGPTSFDGVFKYTSTDGLAYTQSLQLDKYRQNLDGTTYNYTEITSPPLNTYSTTISDMQGHGLGPTFTLSGQSSWIAREDTVVYASGNPKPQYISIIPIDADGSLLGTPAPTRISASYAGDFPGPTYLQNVPYYTEDGIIHIYATHGFHGPADTQCFGYPYPVQWDLAFHPDGILTSFSGTTLRSIKPYSIVLTMPDGTTRHDNGTRIVGADITSGTLNYATGAVSVTFSTPPAAGNINVRYVENDVVFHPSGGSYQVSGGLSEQFLDYHTYIYDAAAAASAAPIGVVASCSGGTVTLSWYDALPANTYRVYRGSTSATQATLVASLVTGISTTDTPTQNQRWWYKVVTLNAGTEAGFRVAHTYVSSASTLANQHATRVIDDGGDVTTINFTRLDAAISFLTTQNWLADLLFWAAPDWGVKLTSGHVTKVYCLGTTRLPRGGDLTFTTSSTTYSATGLNGARGAFTNTTNNAFSYFGNGRFNPIRRKREITVAAMYARTQTSADVTFLGLKTPAGKFETNWLGTEQPGISLSHNAGTPGTVEFKLKDDNFGQGTRQNTATVTAAGGSYGIAIGTSDGSSAVAYSNGGAGTPVTGLDPDPHHFRDTAVAGARGAGLVYPVLGVGSRSCSYTAVNQPPTLTAGTYSFPNNEAQFTASDVFMMARAVDATGAAALNSLLNSFVASSLVKYLIADFAAEGDGIDDDGPELNNMGAFAAADPVNDYTLVFETGHTFRAETAQFWTQGIRSATVSGYGATMYVPPGIGSGFEYGGGYVAALGTAQHAPIQTVARGATSCTLISGTDASKLLVGLWVCVAGFNVQGGGDPPNLMFYEYVEITGISGTTVTFDRPLRQGYKSTWQDLGSARLLVTGTPGGTGSGWDSYIRHAGYTVTGESNGGHSKARDVRLQDMSVPCFTPTQCVSAFLDNVTVTTAFIEVDKLIELFVARDSTVPWVKVQSASPSMLYFDTVACSSLTTGLQGTPRNTVLVGCTLPELVLGSYNGNSKSLTATNCAIASLVFGESSFDRGGDAGASNVQSLYSMSGGVITIPRSAWYLQDYPPWPVPGCVGFFGYSSSSGSFRYGASFKVVDVTADATNIYVATSLVGAWPTLPGGVKTIYMHPCPKLTMTGCTGDVQVVDLSSAPAAVPAGTWSRRTYTRAHTSAIQSLPFVVGRVVEIRINITAAFSSALQVRVFDLPLLNAAGAEFRYEAIVDVSSVHEVVLVPGVAPAGASGADTVTTLPAGAWLVGGGFAGFNSFVNVSGSGSNFSCTVTIRTDQEALADDDPDYAALLAMAQALLGEAVEPPLPAATVHKLIFLPFIKPPLPVITSPSTASVNENSTLAHALTASLAVTWSIVGGADSTRFEISGSTLRWLSNGTKDYESPNDANLDNAYVVTVRATGTGGTTDQAVTVTVTDVSEILSNETVSANEILTNATLSSIGTLLLPHDIT